MARYANHECAECGAVLPADEMTRVTDREHRGSSRTKRRLGDTFLYRDSSQTEHYANRAKWLCPDCARGRSAYRLGLAAIGVAAFVYFGGIDAVSKEIAKYGAPQVVPSNSAVSLAKMAEGGERVPPEQSTAALDIGAEAQAENPSAPTDLESHPRVLKAIGKALKSGKAKRWKADSLRGYAVPSEAASDGCRMVVIAIDDGARLPATKYCPAGAPAAEGEE